MTAYGVRLGSQLLDRPPRQLPIHDWYRVQPHKGGGVCFISQATLCHREAVQKDENVEEPALSSCRKSKKARPRAADGGNEDYHTSLTWEGGKGGLGEGEGVLAPNITSPCQADGAETGTGY